MLLAAPLGIPEALASALAGRYALERALGRGGMATVYLARDIRHDRRVAVKVLRPDIGAAIGADRFLNEIHTTAALQHPHILPLFDSGAINGVLFYVMPYVEGESLQERLTRTGPLPTDQVFRIARATERGQDARLTGTGLSLGTPQYMSPEQAAAERDVGPATDIYSLGAVVYEMLSGTPPFDGPSCMRYWHSCSRSRRHR